MLSFRLKKEISLKENIIVEAEAKISTLQKERKVVVFYLFDLNLS